MHVTIRVRTTCADARIDTAFVQAGRIAGTIRVDHAFGSAVWRPPNVVGNARAHGPIVCHTTVGVATARRWNAWICGLFVFDDN